MKAVFEFSNSSLKFLSPLRTSLFGILKEGPLFKDDAVGMVRDDESMPSEGCELYPCEAVRKAVT